VVVKNYLLSRSLFLILRKKEENADNDSLIFSHISPRGDYGKRDNEFTVVKIRAQETEGHRQ